MARLAPKANEQKTCSICQSSPAVARGYCNPHYHSWWRHGDPLKAKRRVAPPTVCHVPECTKPPYHRGYCGSHYARIYKYGDPLAYRQQIGHRVCSIECCAQQAHAHGWCSKHYGRWKHHGDPNVSAQQREHGDTCTVPGCARPYRKLGMCASHATLSWAKQNPERWAEREARRRARVAGVRREAIDPLVVFERDGRICYLCDLAIDRKDFSLDHVIPVSLGGTHTLDNVRSAHKSCNFRKGARPLVEIAE